MTPALVKMPFCSDYEPLDAALVQIRATRDLTFELHALQLRARVAVQQQWEAARAHTDVLTSAFSDSPVLNYGVLSAASGLVDVSPDPLSRAQPLLRPQRRRRVEQALAVLERLAKYHAIARPVLLRARARWPRTEAAGSPQAQPQAHAQALALEDQAQALAAAQR